MAEQDNATDMDFVNARFIKLKEELMRLGMINQYEEFYQTVGISKQGFQKIKDNKGNVTASHVIAVCKQYNVNANWLLGFERAMFRQPKK